MRHICVNHIIFLGIEASMAGAISWAILEHSSPDLTNKVYTNVNPVLLHAVDPISAKELDPTG